MKTLIKFTLLILLFNFYSCKDGSSEQGIERLSDMSVVYDANVLSIIENNYVSLQFDGANFSMINIPVVIHLVTQDDGSGNTLAGTEIQNITTKLNSLYNNISKLNFEICDIKMLHNSDIYNFELSNSTTLINFLRANHFNSDVLNIYFVNDLIETNSAVTTTGFFHSQGAGDRNSFVLMDRHFMNNSSKTLEHEIGHFFYLYHTHGNINCGFTADGDFVDDTPFDTNLFGNCDGSRVDAFCNYTGNDGYNPDTSNIMSYSRPSCKTRLSDGQLIRVGNVARNTSLRGYLINNSCDNNVDCSSFYFTAGHNSAGCIDCVFPLEVDISSMLGGLHGGTLPFTYKLDGITNQSISYPYQNSTVFTIPEEGRYRITVKDANSCEINKSTETHLINH